MFKKYILFRSAATLQERMTNRTFVRPLIFVLFFMLIFCLFFQTCQPEGQKLTTETLPSPTMQQILPPTPFLPTSLSQFMSLFPPGGAHHPLLPPAGLAHGAHPATTPPSSEDNMSPPPPPSQNKDDDEQVYILFSFLRTIAQKYTILSNLSIL